VTKECPGIVVAFVTFALFIGFHKMWSVFDPVHEIGAVLFGILLLFPVKTFPDIRRVNPLRLAATLPLYVLLYNVGYGVPKIARA